jgi:hypothetical protein
MNTIPKDATSLECFCIRNNEAYIGFKIPNGNFEFIQIPYTGKEENSVSDLDFLDTEEYKNKKAQAEKMLNSEQALERSVANTLNSNTEPLLNQKEDNTVTSNQQESGLVLKQQLDGETDTIEQLVEDYVTYLELDEIGEIDEKGDYKNYNGHIFSCIRRAKERVNNREFQLLIDILKKRVKKEELCSQQQNKDEAVVVSHPCTSSNYYQHINVENFIKAAISETSLAMLEWIKEDTVIRDRNGAIVPDAEIDLSEHPKSLIARVYQKLEKHGIKLVNSEQNDAVSDTTEADKGDEAGIKKAMLQLKGMWGNTEQEANS